MIRKLLTSSVVILGLAGPSPAATVDVALSLVIDISGSIDDSEYNQQMDGYANAFRDAQIQAGILDMGNGDVGAVAVNVVMYASSAAVSRVGPR